jgi:AcrR family transcriptional regulator
MAGMRASTAKRRNVRVAPTQIRSVQTRERLLDVAGELLADVGIERISTNLICARAGVTPPALYRYFKDKYAVLEALGLRLMERQNEVLMEWLDRYAPQGLDVIGEHVEDLLRATADVTASQPGSIWILRALRAVPQLAHVRLESHRLVTDRLAKAYGPLVPQLSKKVLWQRVRIGIEFGFAIDEMMTEETLIKRDDAIREAARMLRWSLRDPQ